MRNLWQRFKQARREELEAARLIYQAYKNDEDVVISHPKWLKTKWRVD